MEKWLHNLNYNPLTSLLKCNNEAILVFIKRDLLGKIVSIDDLKQLAEPQKILRKQRPDGSWKYPGTKNDIRLQGYYDQYETFKNLAILIEMFGFNKKHSAIARTAEYFFSVQSREGDFRGIYGNQYSPNYSASIAELLIKACYADNTHIEKHFSGCSISGRMTEAGHCLLELRAMELMLPLITRRQYSPTQQNLFRIWLPERC